MNAADVLQTVEYSRDKWNMERVPRALVFCFVGMVFVLYIDPRPLGPGFLRAFVVLLIMAAIGAAISFLYALIVENRSVAIRLCAAGIALAAVTMLYWNNPAGLFHVRYPKGPDVAPYLFGWIIITGAIGWIAFALYRHLNPARPILKLSPAGIHYSVSGLRDLLIPWHEVQGVNGLEIPGGDRPPHLFPDITVILISNEFYQRHILVKRGYFETGGWRALFRPKGALMQMVLHHELFSIEPGQIREPVRLRWQAFRNGTSSQWENAPISQERQVYGTWSIDGSPWQAIKFLVPLLGIVAVLVASMGI
ncbi:MAG: hypothetical protein AB7I42_02260 [Bradyrhizobium sp.]|uniref:hypothetical protein n=1 Tax=Bradyrhizobium sp. TaxID=376 RepID=UPI003D147771